MPLTKYADGVWMSAAVFWTIVSSIFLTSVCMCPEPSARYLVFYKDPALTSNWHQSCYSVISRIFAVLSLKNAFLDAILCFYFLFVISSCIIPCLWYNISFLFRFLCCAKFCVCITTFDHMFSVETSCLFRLVKCCLR